MRALSRIKLNTVFKSSLTKQGVFCVVVNTSNFVLVQENFLLPPPELETASSHLPKCEMC